MSTIGGKKREQIQVTEYAKKVGLFEAKVVAINPDAEEYKEILNIELKEDSKAIEYLGTNADGDTKLRIDVWLEEIKNKEKFKVSFFLENKEKVNRDGTKKQYINTVGTTSWADDANNLGDWFTSRDYRVAFIGEEDLYTFLRTWLGGLDYRDAETTLSLDWKKLMKGNVKDLKDQIGGEFTTSVVALATIKTVVKDEGTKEYQSVYNKAFLPAYAIKQFRLVDFGNSTIVSGLRAKKLRDLNVTGEYGCRDFYILKDLKEYNSEDNFAASDAPISTDGADY